MGLHSINKGTKSFSGGGLPFYLEEDYVFSKINAGYIGGGEWRVPNEKLPTFQIWSIRDNVILFQYKGIRADGTYTGAIFTPPIGLITKTAVKKDGIQYYVYSTSDADILATLPDGGRWIIELTIETIIGGATTTYYSEQFVTTDCSTTCYSIDLDGVNEYIEAPLNPAYDIEGTSPMSFGVWVKFDTLAATSPILTKWTIFPRGIQFNVIPAGEIQFHLQNFGGVSGLILDSVGGGIGVGVWNHLAITYDGSELAAGVKFYRNGILLGNSIITNSLSGTIITNETVKIGSSPAAGLYSNALINIARWWDVELTAAEVLTQYTAPVGATPVQAANLIFNLDVTHSTFNGTEWDIEDLTGITAGYQTVNAEEEDRIEDCP